MAGHAPTEWTSNCNGTGTHCTQCGAHVAVTISRKLVREFPEDTCEQRIASVAKTSAERGW